MYERCRSMTTYAALWRFLSKLGWNVCPSRLLKRWWLTISLTQINHEAPLQNFHVICSKRGNNTLGEVVWRMLEVWRQRHQFSHALGIFNLAKLYNEFKRLQLAPTTSRDCRGLDGGARDCTPWLGGRNRSGVQLHPKRRRDADLNIFYLEDEGGKPSALASIEDSVNSWMPVVLVVQAGQTKPMANPTDAHLALLFAVVSTCRACFFGVPVPVRDCFSTLWTHPHCNTIIRLPTWASILAIDYGIIW